MRKHLLMATACLLWSVFASAQLNVTFRSQLTFPGKSLANIWGYSDSLNREYALVGTTAGMSIVDVTNATAPALLFNIVGANSQWREVRTYGKYAYVATEGGGGLQIVNLSYLPDSAPSKFWTGNGAIAGLSRIHTVHVDGDNIFLNGCRNSGGSYLFNGASLICSLTDPWNPNFVGHTSTGVSSTVDYVHDGQALGNRLYAGHIYDGKFSIYDITNKAAPVLLNKQITTNAFCHNTWLNGASNVVFTTDEVSNSYLTAYDVSNPNNIQYLDKIQSQNPGSGSIIHNTYIKNEYAVCSYYRDGFIIVDASRPGNLVLTGWYDTSPSFAGNGFNGAWGVYPYFPSGNVVVSDIENGLFVLTPNYVRACHIEGVVTDQSTSLAINGASVSISGPATLAETSAANGQYKTGTSTAGTYTVTVSKAGYVTNVTSGVVLTNGILTTLNIALVPVGSCGTPTGLSATSITQTTVTLNWGAVSGAVSYNVQYRAVGAGTWTNGTSASTSLAISGLVASTNYEFQVQALCSGTSGTYSTLGTFTTLAPGGNCTSDIYETNNTSSTTKTIAVNTDIYALIGVAGDLDWFRFTTVSPNTKLKATLTQVPFDYDLRLYSNSNSLLTTSQNGGTTSETIIRNATTAATYKLRVYGYNGAFSATSCYKLRVDVSSVNYVKTIPQDIETFKYTAENELNAFPNPATDAVAFIFESDIETTGSISIFDLTGRMINNTQINVIEGQNMADLNIAYLANGVYIVEVFDGTETIKVKVVKE
nr:choice-of-anchor B family protein [Bacteroidota bacterium]